MSSALFQLGWAFQLSCATSTRITQRRHLCLWQRQNKGWNNLGVAETWHSSFSPRSTVPPSPAMVESDPFVVGGREGREGREGGSLKNRSNIFCRKKRGRSSRQGAAMVPWLARAKIWLGEGVRASTSWRRRTVTLTHPVGSRR